MPGNPEHEAQLRTLSSDELRRRVRDLEAHAQELERRIETLQQELRAAADRAESSPVGEVLLTLTGTVVEANPAAAQMFGVRREELLTVPLTRYLARDSQEAFHRHIQQALGGAVPVSSEIDVQLDDGAERVFRLESIAIQSPEGRNRCRSILVDVTDHRRHTRDLRLKVTQVEGNLAVQTAESERISRKLQAEISQRQRIEVERQMQTEIVGTVADGVCLVRSEDGRVLFTNPQFDELLGYMRGELLGRFAGELYAPDEELHGEQLREIRGALERRQVWRGELRIVRKDRVLRWCRTSLAPFEHVQHGTVWIAVLTDVTAQHEYQAALHEREILARSILDSLPAHLAVLDATGTIIAVNRAWEDFARDSGGNRVPASFLGINYLQICRQAEKDLHPEFHQVPAALRDILEGKQPSLSFEYECHSPERQAWFLMHATPLLHERGGAVISHTPITERVLAEHALKQSEHRLRDIVNTAADAIVTHNFDGIITAVNPAAERMFGWSADELVGRNVATLLPSPYRERNAECLREYRETGRPQVLEALRELYVQRKDGSTFPVEVAVSAVEELQLFTSIIRDISERKSFQQQLLTVAESEQRRIGRDLHDEVGQQLTGLGLSAMALADALSEKSLAEAKLARRLSEGLAEALAYVRSLSRGLVSPQIDPADLPAALGHLADRCMEMHGTACRFEQTNSIRVASGEVATQLFRIAQEAIANAVRHGKAQNVTVSLRVEGELLTLEIRDDGVGLPEPGQRGQGAGLQIMESRAGLIGATLNISHPSSGGTMVSCTLPVELQ